MRPDGCKLSLNTCAPGIHRKLCRAFAKHYELDTLVAFAKRHNAIAGTCAPHRLPNLTVPSLDDVHHHKPTRLRKEQHNVIAMHCERRRPNCRNALLAAFRGSASHMQRTYSCNVRPRAPGVGCEPRGRAGTEGARGQKPGLHPVCHMHTAGTCGQTCHAWAGACSECVSTP